MRLPQRNWRLIHHAYCGMSIPHGEFHHADRDDARAAAARLLRRRRRQGYPVSILEAGKSWEIGEPDDCMMVPDESGVLQLHTPSVPDNDDC
jgi:hypothetical protein